MLQISPDSKSLDTPEDDGSMSAGKTVNRLSDIFDFHCMSPGSAQRFRDNDMHQNKDLKRVA
ncbi:hypothetical protein DPM35_24010 [Mesorhizobium atlanticum]|uniref:Uncharacterized protein n=1 Tax=Mesorhizobium atlanticum TaxID=2233532 RepID=A0A330GR63_9HYPH|nr:hypothetical protein DPM35_24010 [Mesorhizobium atlanticum]